MNYKTIACLGAAICSFFTLVQPVGAQGTAFTYQGRLNVNGAPANGNYDFQFILFNVSQFGFPDGPILTNAAVFVTNGLFTTTLDFGPGILTGTNLWLDLSARTNGSGSFTQLSPRQPLTPAPYAIFASAAGSLSGSLPAAQLSGTISNGSLPASPTFAGTVTAGSLAGNGANVANVNAVTLNGLGSASFWNTTGNAGTSPTNGNFLGTQDNQPLELRVANSRVARFEPNTNGAPNVIAGSVANYVTPGVVGAAIGGGGALNYNGITLSNSVTADFGTIGGGCENKTTVVRATIGGGAFNTANGDNATVAGGYDNEVDSASSTIGGGIYNVVQSNGTYSCIGGGYGNVIQSNSVLSIICGGNQNIIQPLGGSTAIVGGYGNTIYSNSSGCFIGGGGLNNILYNNSESAISGGFQNNIQSGVLRATIAGGNNNSIQSGANYSAVSGGTGGLIQTNAFSSTIAGGQGNTVNSGAYYGTVGGGVNNIIGGAGGTIPGGNGNGAIGVNSFAAGTFAQATNDGSFVLSDQTYVNFYSTAVNQFSARFNGGYRFVTGTGKSVVFTVGAGVNQTVTWTPGSASWSFSSDRNLKDRFASVDTQSVLDRVAQLPITEWSYKGYDQRHIGAMAQDFHTLFPLNSEDKVLNDADLHGVELAAIKGLNEKLERENAELKARLEKIERRLDQQ